MGEPGAPKRSEAELGRLAVASGQPPRAPSQAPPGARAIPTRNPKAPLPPRASQVDALEAANNVLDRIEPEPESIGGRTLALSSSQISRKPSHPSQHPGPSPSQYPSSHAPTSGHEDAETAAILPKDFHAAVAQLQQQVRSSTASGLARPATDPQMALAQLQRQRESGAPAPPPPQSRPSLHNGLVGAETMRMDSPRRLPSARDVNSDVPSARDLAKDFSSRAQVSEPPPPPIVPIVPSTKSITAPFGPTSMKSGSTALAPNRTPAPIAVVSGSSLRINSPDRPMPVTPTRPQGTLDFTPPPMPYPAPPSAPSSRPSTQPKSFAPPAGGPPISYERAFRQWSSPNITPADDPSAPGNLGTPVTFQVYTAQDIGTGRPMRSLPAMPLEAKKPNIALRVGMALVGAIVVLLTAAAVIAVSTEDPKRPAPSATVAPPPPPTLSAPEPPPSTISIGDPDPVDELPPTHATAPAATAKTPKPKPTNTVPAAPASLKGIAPPPNPYGK